MKKTIKGYLFNKIEKLGGKKYNHIGFEGKNQSFGDLLASFVPKIGMKKEVKLTIEMLDKKNKELDNKSFKKAN